MKANIQFVERLLADAIYETEFGCFMRRDLPDGAAQWSVCDGEIHSLLFVCPCGCKKVRTVPVKMQPNPAHAWWWDGQKESPTLKPSIQIVGECQWHGWLTAGEWRQC
jgi:Family of unknown function (DUF6527)